MDHKENLVIIQCINLQCLFIEYKTEFKKYLLFGTGAVA